MEKYKRNKKLVQSALLIIPHTVGNVIQTDAALLHCAQNRSHALVNYKHLARRTQKEHANLTNLSSLARRNILLPIGSNRECLIIQINALVGLLVERLLDCAVTI